MMKSIVAAAVLFLAAACSLCAADGVAISKGKDSIEFKIGDALVTRCIFGETVAKPYFWPIFAPGDVPVTRDVPAKGLVEMFDHPHQKSMWFCHGDVIAQGLEMKEKTKGIKGIDFWTEMKGAGKIVCVEVGEPKNGPTHGSIRTRNEWRTPEGTKVLDETRVIHLYALPGGGRLLALDIDLDASVYPITFGDTKEGSMGVRVSDDLVVKKGGHFVNAQGDKVDNPKAKDAPIWGNPSDWVDYVGSIGGKTVGIAVFDDPNNTPRASWHARDYGLLAANPFGRQASGFPSQKGKTDLVKLDKGEHLKLRYGVFIHEGDTKQGKVAEAFDVFKKKAE
jgi:hypothetical protein